MVNVLTKDDPELKTILEWDYETINEEHRKGASYFCNVLVHVDEDCPVDPKFRGHWMSDVIVAEYDWGIERDYIDKLYRVEERKVTTTSWVRVEPKPKG